MADREPYYPGEWWLPGAGIAPSPLRLLEPHEHVRHRYPPGVLGPCRDCDMGARLQLPNGDLVCPRHAAAGRLTADQRRAVEARRRRPAWTP